MAKNSKQKSLIPNPALKLCEKLIGKWELKGRTLDSKKKTFPASVYASMSGDVLSYEWDIRGNILIHSGLGATYRGTISEDGNTITGGWRPNEGTPTTDGTAYDAVMVRVRYK